MTAQVDIYNRALQILGTRTTVTAAEISDSSTNEAIQLNLIWDQARRKLIRMAPWNFALKTVNLNYITSAPGTPENTSAATTLWEPGQPPPPWMYEYQYPVDCVRACFIIPATQTGFAGGVPITTAVTGGAPQFWNGPPVKFKVQNDQFYAITGATVADGGTGYAVGDLVTMALAPNTSPPIGAPATLLVTSISAGGVITGVSIAPSIYGEATPQSGAYFAEQADPQEQGTTTGSGSGATFDFSGNWIGPGPQRVILTNQEFATLTYCQDVLDPNIWDDAFQEALSSILGAMVTIPLAADQNLAKLAIQRANEIIEQTRTMDGVEGYTINDVTPDWIRFRGIDFPDAYGGPWSGFDWGGLYPTLG